MLNEQLASKKKIMVSHQEGLAYDGARLKKKDKRAAI